ncbi:MAG TPA: hypothetical protein VFJ79_01295 [Acidimicrobiales bacterium]|nr:hypothetical protein [Acidimicrobiales bacterium]
MEDFAPRAEGAPARRSRRWLTHLRGSLHLSLQVRRRFLFSLLATLAALGLEQATAVAAGSSFEALPAAKSVAVQGSAARSLPSSVTVPPAPTTTTPPVTTPPTTTPPATTHQLATTTSHRAPSVQSPSASGYGCGPALAYLAAHSAPGFHFECPGYSLGHQAMTCIDIPGVCAGEKLIVISVPCRAAYMNEAANSWSVQGLSNTPIDPYGYCH